MGAPISEVVLIEVPRYLIVVFWIQFLFTIFGILWIIFRSADMKAQAAIEHLVSVVDAVKKQRDDAIAALAAEKATGVTLAANQLDEGDNAAIEKANAIQP